MNPAKHSSELRQALGELQPYFKRAAWLSVVASLLVLAPSAYMLEVYDRVVNSRSHMTLAMLTLLVLAVFVVMAGFVDLAALRPLHVLVNCGNGAAGPSFDALAAELAARGAPLRFTLMHHTPDGSFPNGIPNPLLPENQPATARAVVAAAADLGVAFDGDFDRCFLFDASGGFVPGEYVVALLAEAFLGKAPGSVIVHDPRVIWATQDAVARGGGRAVMARTGHSFLKQAMRDTGAIYGGEMSAHHYFRDFMACDSGMIPWLLVAELIGRGGHWPIWWDGCETRFRPRARSTFASTTSQPRWHGSRRRWHHWRGRAMARMGCLWISAPGG